MNTGSKKIKISKFPQVLYMQSNKSTSTRLMRSKIYHQTCQLLLSQNLNRRGFAVDVSVCDHGIFNRDFHTHKIVSRL